MARVPWHDLLACIVVLDDGTVVVMAERSAYDYAYRFETQSLQRSIDNVEAHFKRQMAGVTERLPERWQVEGLEREITWLRADLQRLEARKVTMADVRLELLVSLSVIVLIGLSAWVFASLAVGR